MSSPKENLFGDDDDENLFGDDSPPSFPKKASISPRKRYSTSPRKRYSTSPRKGHSTSPRSRSTSPRKGASVSPRKQNIRSIQINIGNDPTLIIESNHIGNYLLTIYNHINDEISSGKKSIVHGDEYFPFIEPRHINPKHSQLVKMAYCFYNGKTPITHIDVNDARYISDKTTLQEVFSSTEGTIFYPYLDHFPGFKLEIAKTINKIIESGCISDEIQRQLDPRKYMLKFTVELYVNREESVTHNFHHDLDGNSVCLFLSYCNSTVDAEITTATFMLDCSEFLLPHVVTFSLKYPFNTIWGKNIQHSTPSNAEIDLISDESEKHRKFVPSSNKSRSFCRIVATLVPIASHVDEIHPFLSRFAQYEWEKICHYLKANKHKGNTSKLNSKTKTLIVSVNDIDQAVDSGISDLLERSVRGVRLTGGKKIKNKYKKTKKITIKRKEKTRKL